MAIYGDHGSRLDYSVAGYTYNFSKHIQHVPFLIHVPTMAPLCLQQPLSHYDIAPTISNLLNIETPNEWIGSSIFDRGERRLILNLPKETSLSWTQDQIRTDGLSDRERSIVRWSESKQSNF